LFNSKLNPNHKIKDQRLPSHPKPKI
jgi:hypothetical protein